MGKIYRPSLDRPSSRTDEYPMPPCTLAPDVFIQLRTVKMAKAICMSCPLRNDCRTKVMRQKDDPGGVYAALSKADRDSIRKRVTCEGA